MARSSFWPRSFEPASAGEPLAPSAPRRPDCQKGKVYEVAKSGVLVRIVGQAPVQAKVYELQRLRCNLCGKVFTAQVPEGVG